MSKSSPPRTLTKSIAGISVWALALVCQPSAGIAQADMNAEQPTTAQVKSVPALDEFAEIPLPRGNFKGWCGRRDRFLVGFEGQLEAYEGNSKVVIPTMIPFATDLHCDEEGQQLAYVSMGVGRAVKVDIASGQSQILAEFAPSYTLAERSEFSADMVSISPDFRVIAADGKLVPARNVEVIPLPSPRRVGHVRWSPDSSRLFYVLHGQGRNSVEVIDTNRKKLGGGHLPKEGYFRDGWFAEDGKSLLLYVGGDFGPGFLFRCRIAAWKCDRMKSNIDEISVGGRGRIGTISPYRVKPNPSHYADGSIPIHPMYLAEVMDATSTRLARQVVSTRESRAKRWYKLLVSPGGTKVVLTWEVDKHGGCVPPNWGDPCIEARMFDLSRGVR